MRVVAWRPPVHRPDIAANLESHQGVKMFLMDAAPPGGSHDIFVMVFAQRLLALVWVI